MLTFLFPFTLLTFEAEKKEEGKVKGMPGLKHVIPGGEHLSASCRAALCSSRCEPFSFLSVFQPGSRCRNSQRAISKRSHFHWQRQREGISHRGSRAAQAEMEEQRGGNAKHATSRRRRPLMADVPRRGKEKLETLTLEQNKTGENNSG